MQQLETYHGPYVMAVKQAVAYLAGIPPPSGSRQERASEQDPSPLQVSEVAPQTHHSDRGMTCCTSK